MAKVLVEWCGSGKPLGDAPSFTQLSACFSGCTDDIKRQTTFLQNTLASSMHASAGFPCLFASSEQDDLTEQFLSWKARAVRVFLGHGGPELTAAPHHQAKAESCLQQAWQAATAAFATTKKEQVSVVLAVCWYSPREVAFWLAMTSANMIYRLHCDVLNDKNFVLACLQARPELIQAFARSQNGRVLCADPDIVLAAGQHDSALACASHELQQDACFVGKVTQCCPHAFLFADASVFQQVEAFTSKILPHASIASLIVLLTQRRVVCSKDLLLAIFSKHGALLEYAPSSNVDVVTAAVSNCPRAIKYAKLSKQQLQQVISTYMKGKSLEPEQIIAQVAELFASDEEDATTRSVEFKVAVEVLQRRVNFDLKTKERRFSPNVHNHDIFKEQSLLKTSCHECGHDFGYPTEFWKCVVCCNWQACETCFERVSTNKQQPKPITTINPTPPFYINL